MNRFDLHTMDTALRAGSAALLLLLGAALLRARGGLAAARLGAAFAIGVAAYAAYPPGSVPSPALTPLAALSAGNGLVFWLFTRALFDDDFRPRAWHVALWGLFAVAGALQCAVFRPAHGVAAVVTGMVLTLVPLGFSLLAVAQTLASWRDDLVEGRRRLRGPLVALVVAYTAVFAVVRLLDGSASASPLASLAEAAGLLCLVAWVAWRLLGWQGDGLFAPVASPADPPPEARPTAAPSEAEPDPVRLPAPEADPALVAALQGLMAEEQVYREEALTVGALAERLGLPEYKLRRLINQGLGYRNFSSFLNSYRLADAKRALTDPAMAQVPVLTIAMDAGFQSLGPFNRAFKADTGLTPTDYRRLGGLPTPGNAPMTLADSETG
ncbi:helix-turn-helix domain-containing protein [Ideonella sp. BN130291]|uniref:helix-turn-helix domain-containing protein n=1 Tax=Ideonella sp. BN130291 TaxID=3112940 RepID=UPI002E25A3BE|nr:helix-turn-helix domain-containing protein [Ideonella sp. BN130291]